MADQLVGAQEGEENGGTERGKDASWRGTVLPRPPPFLLFGLHTILSVTPVSHSSPVIFSLHSSPYPMASL